MLKERADATREQLGLEKYEAPIFYTCPVGIRFEIGVDSPYASNRVLRKRYVKDALKRAYSIYQNAPGSFDTLLWVIHPDGNTSEDRLLNSFIKITRLPLPLFLWMLFTSQ
ncbi:MAG: hypothetical protein VB106_19540 [Clostridiaceae bacterium]|nr:hypothetical protein [Clostridiaceae bacterium]